MKILERLCLALLALAGCLQADVVINELNYNPPGSADDTEFIELYNSGSQTVDIAGWYFSSGVDFVFPRGATIPAGGFAVAARNLQAFKKAYPGVRCVFGPFAGGKLSNSGETVELCNQRGALVSSVSYLDGGEWPSECDGDGPTLELRNPNLPLGKPSSWAASASDGGTPGAVNSVHFPDDTVLLEDFRQPVSPLAAETVTLGVRASYGAILGAKLHYGKYTLTCTKSDNWFKSTLVAYSAGSVLDYWFEVETASGTLVLSNRFTALEKRIPAGAVVINEIMFRSGQAASDDEYQYVELYNRSGETVELKDCALNGIPLSDKSLKVAPGEYLVAPSKKKAFQAVYGDKIPLAPCKLKLYGDSGTIRLTDCNGGLIHAAAYGSKAPWPSLSAGTGCSLELISPELDALDSASFGASRLYGSPGAKNTASGEVPALSVTPFITEPLRSGAAFNVAFLVAGDNVQDVTMNYALGTGTLASLNLSRDPESGLFSGKVPSQQAGVLRYRLSIVKDGKVCYWPVKDEAKEPDAPSMTTRMSYESHKSTVTPTDKWQKYSITDNASDSSKMYVYMDAAGEILLDNFTMTDGSGKNYLRNSGFDSNITYWTLSGNHMQSYWDNTDGAGDSKGCLHVVATGPGGGNSSGGNIIPTFETYLSSGSPYTLSFYYKRAPQQQGSGALFRYLEIGAPERTLAISEINYHEMHASFGNCEFVEIKNYGTLQQDLAGLTLESREKGLCRLPNAFLPAGGLLYLCADTNAFRRNFPQAGNISALGFAMSHGSDLLTLKDIHGEVLDQAAYDDGAGSAWPREADGRGASLERLDLSSNGTDPASWQPAFNGTVGYTAGDFRIRTAYHTPAVPTSGSRVYFHCFVENPKGTPTGTLYYKVNGGWQTKSLSYSESARRFSTNLSGFSHNNQVAFYFEIKDGSEVRTFPAWGAERPAMFEIDDNTDYQIPVFRIMMTSANYSKLSSQRLWNNNCTDCTLIVGTNVYYNAAIHYKGNYSRQYRIAHNIRFNYGQKYKGHDKIAYTYNWEDGSPFLAVGFAQRIYRLGKTPIYDSEAILTRRMGSLQGLMHTVAGYDDTHLTSLGYDGNCYKATAASAQQAMFSYADYKKKTYENCYEPLANMNPERQYKDLAQGLEALYIFNEKDYNSRVTNYFDVTAMAKEWAMMKFINNSDGWTQWGQNYILYGDRKTGRLQLWPQDIGSCIVWGNVPMMPVVSGIQRFSRHPAVFKAFYDQTTNLMQTIPLIKQQQVFESLRNLCANDAKRNDSSYESEANGLWSTIRSWHSARDSNVGSPTYITNMTFAFRSLPPKCAMVGEPYYYRPFAFGAGPGEVSYSITTGNTGLTMGPDGLISGVFKEKGNVSYTVRATKGGRSITQSVALVVQEPALRLHIPMEEGKGTTIRDREGKMTGTLKGDVTWDSDGRYGKCLAFGSGIADEVDMGKHSDINISGSFTCEAWFYFTQRNRRYWGQIFEKGEELGWRQDGDNSTHHGGRIAYGPLDNAYSCADGFPSGDSMIMDRYNSDDNQRIIEPNQWHHFAATYEKEHSEVFVYLDGKRLAGMTWTGNLMGTSELLLGGQLNGKLDEFKIYSFAKRAFNMGLNIEAVQTTPGAQYVQFHAFDRQDGEDTNLKYFALQVNPGNRWYVLPSEKVRPGEDLALSAEDIAEDFELPPSGSLALYPFEPESPFPEYYLTNDYTKILDYVAYGDASALPTEQEAAVKAGLWKAGTIVLPDQRSFRLKQRGQNNDGASSWENALELEAPVITDYSLTNTENQIVGSWKVSGSAASYTVQIADNPYFQNPVVKTLGRTQLTYTAESGRWYWRVQANYPAGKSVFSAPVSTCLIPEPAALGALCLAALALLRRRL